MGYLIANDYLRQITDVSIGQIVAGNAYLQKWAELTALKQIGNYLRFKYDVDAELSETNVYKVTSMYKAGDRVYLDAAAYSASSLYPLKSLVLQNGLIYQCTTAINTPQPFNDSNWVSLGSQYDIFFAKYPYPVFSSESYYSEGEIVFWKNKIYAAIISTPLLSQSDIIQFESTKSIPPPTAFPDDVVNGKNYWKYNSDYTVAADSLLQSTYWMSGDNRHPQIVMFCIDVALYHLYGRIAPKSIPEVRTDRYNAAIAELKMIARGEIASDLTKIQPGQGASIRWGSKPKQQNHY